MGDIAVPEKEESLSGHEILAKLGVVDWDFFVRAILENNSRRNSLLESELNKKIFAQKIQKIARPSKYFPSYARGNPKDKENGNNRAARALLKTLFGYYQYTLSLKNKSICFQTVNKGLGMKATRDITAETRSGVNFFLPDELWGILYYIEDDEVWNELKKLKYPSLFSYHTYRGIAVGPVCLLNHQCNSPLALQGTKLTPSQQHTVPEDIYDLVGEGFILLRVKCSQEGFTISQGEEICIQYAPEIREHFTTCHCKICWDSGKWNETRVDWDYVIQDGSFKNSAPFSNETYGETRPILVNEFIARLPIKEDDVFFDLGSGIGTVAMQVSMNTGCKAIGIEKEEARYQAALRLLEQCEKIDPSVKERVQFWPKDLMCDGFDLSKATVIFVSNWCFSEELQLKLLDLFKGLDPGTKIIALKSLYGQRGNKKRKVEDILVQEFSIKGPANSASWTSSPIDCCVYTRI